MAAIERHLVQFLIVLSIVVCCSGERGYRAQGRRNGGTSQPSRRYDPIAFMALCDPGQCVNNNQKSQIRGCMDPTLVSFYQKCTLGGTEECDIQSTRIIRTCLVRKLRKYNKPYKNCHKNVLHQATSQCLSINWRNKLKGGPQAIRSLPLPNMIGQREVEFAFPRRMHG